MYVISYLLTVDDQAMRTIRKKNEWGEDRFIWVCRRCCCCSWLADSDVGGTHDMTGYGHIIYIYIYTCPVSCLICIASQHVSIKRGVCSVRALNDIYSCRPCQA